MSSWSKALRAAVRRAPRIDQQSRFRIDGLEPGAYNMLVAEPNGATHSRQLEIQVDQDILVDLNPPAVLAGTVIDRATRQPLAGAHLIAIVVDTEAEVAPGAEEPRIPAGYALSNADGEYRLEFAPGPSTALTVQREGYEGFGLPLDLVPGERRGGFMIELQPE